MFLCPQVQGPLQARGMRGCIPFIGNLRCEDRGSSLLGLCARAIGAYLHTLEVIVIERWWIPHLLTAWTMRRSEAAKVMRLRVYSAECQCVRVRRGATRE